MFVLDDYRFQDELRTLTTVDEAIRKARRFRRLCCGMLFALVIAWAGLATWSTIRAVSVIPLFTLFILMSVLCYHLARTDARVKSLLLRRQSLRESEQNQNAKG